MDNWSLGQLTCRPTSSQCHIYKDPVLLQQAYVAHRGPLRLKEACRGLHRDIEASICFYSRPQWSTAAHRGQQRPTEANRDHSCPQLPKEAHRGPQRPKDAHRGPQLPTAAHSCPQRPTDAHRGPHAQLPTEAHSCPQRPTAPNVELI